MTGLKFIAFNKQMQGKNLINYISARDLIVAILTKQFITSQIFSSLSMASVANDLQNVDI